MEQGLVIAILVAVIVLLVGLLALLVLAAAILAYNNRQQDLRDAKARKQQKERVRNMPPRDVSTPTPISRMATPMPLEFVVPADADEAATEVMNSRAVAAFYDTEDDTGATEVRSHAPDDGHLQLEDTEETTEVGERALAPPQVTVSPGRVVAEKK